MQRPEVICHVFATVDGRIDGAFMGDPAAVPSRTAYGQLQAGYEADAIAYGATTLKGFIGSCEPGGVLARARGARRGRRPARGLAPSDPVTAHGRPAA